MFATRGARSGETRSPLGVKSLIPRSHSRLEDYLTGVNPMSGPGVIS